MVRFNRPYGTRLGRRDLLPSNELLGYFQPTLRVYWKMGKNYFWQTGLA